MNKWPPPAVGAPPPICGCVLALLLLKQAACGAVCEQELSSVISVMVSALCVLLNNFFPLMKESTLYSLFLSVGARQVRAFQEPLMMVCQHFVSHLARVIPGTPVPGPCGCDLETST